jgi:hypothetical protein
MHTKCTRNKRCRKVALENDRYCAVHRANARERLAVEKAERKTKKVVKKMSGEAKETYEADERVRLENEKKARKQIKKETTQKKRAEQKRAAKKKRKDVKVKAEITEAKTRPSTLIHIAPSSLPDSGSLPMPNSGSDSSLSVVLNSCLPSIFYDPGLDPQSMLIAKGPLLINSPAPLILTYVRWTASAMALPTTLESIICACFVLSTIDFCILIVSMGFSRDT